MKGGVTRTVATIAKNNTEQIHVRVIEHPDVRLVDLRVFSPTRTSQGEPVPTRAGVCFPVEHAASVIEALRAAEASEA